MAEIAACLGCAVLCCTVRKQITILKTLPSTTLPLPVKNRTDRKREVTANMKVRMSLFVKRNPFKTAHELHNEVFGWSGISERRIQEVLKNLLGLPSRVAATKPMLTENKIKKQLTFAKSTYTGGRRSRGSLCTRMSQP
jgi:hypothetical protein